MEEIFAEVTFASKELKINKFHSCFSYLRDTLEIKFGRICVCICAWQYVKT